MTGADSLSPAPAALRHIIVAIDGPAGAGKSTVARHLARYFGLLNLETGAMYRAFALKALRRGISLDDSAALEELAADSQIKLEAGEEENRVFLDDEDVTGLIRNQTVTDAASRVSVFPPDSGLDGSTATADGRRWRCGNGRARHRDRGLSSCRRKDFPGCRS